MENEEQRSTHSKRVYGEVEMNVLSAFLQATCTSLLDVKADMFHKEIHLNATQELLKHFVEDHTNSTLVISKVERPHEDVNDDEVGEEAEEACLPDKIFDLKFSSTIQYY